MAIKKVTIVGGNGTLGSHILSALVSTNAFDVSILKRASSTSPSPPGSVRLIEIPDSFTFDDIKHALGGQDAVISSFRLNNVEDHVRFAEAAAAAGVRRFIPADFGSCDATSPRAQKLLKLYRDKDRVRERAEQLTKEYTGFSWTTLVCGHFFDWGLREGFLHFDLNGRKVDLLDGGDIRASTSTLQRVSEATVKVLQLEEQTRNKALYVQSFCVTQNEVLTALEKKTGVKWDVRNLGSAEFIEEYRESSAAGDAQAVEEVVFALGTVDANWETKEGFAMELLGLRDENLDEVLDRILSSDP